MRTSHARFGIPGSVCQESVSTVLQWGNKLKNCGWRSENYFLVEVFNCFAILFDEIRKTTHKLAVSLSFLVYDSVWAISISAS